MSRCTAPVRGHSSASAAENCPVCRYKSRGYSSYSSNYPTHTILLGFLVVAVAVLVQFREVIIVVKEELLNQAGQVNFTNILYSAE
jgi:hypothetical protein